MAKVQRINNSKSFSIAVRALCGLLVGVVVTGLCVAYILLVENQAASSGAALMGSGMRRFVPIAFICIAACEFLFVAREKAPSVLFKYRWVIACIVVLLGVLFEISGSSIGLLLDAMGVDGTSIYGVPRPIRSDEWALFTPMALSQCVTDGGSFSYYQDAMRGIPTDMFCIYGQPVWDIAEIFRPFQWGYLILGASRGLAFYWCGRFVFLFMVSFEFAYRFLTDESKILSFGYACLVALAGVVQWWFSINNLVEILLFGQLALVWGQCYLRTKSYRSRILYALGIAWCLGVFLLAFYPAWQIPFGYVFLVCLIALLIREARHSELRWIDALICLGMIAVVVAAAAYVFLYKSWDTVQTVLNTAYPGHRESYGGGEWRHFFIYPLGVVAPLSQTGLTPNVCEAASFYTAFPLCIVLPILTLRNRNRQVNRRLLVCALLTVVAIIGCYSVFGFPELLAKYTLMDKTTGSRAVIAVQFAMLMLLFCSLDRLESADRKKLAGAFVISLVLETVGCYLAMPEAGMTKIAVSVVVLALFMLALFYMLVKVKPYLFCCACLVVALLSGALANPIRGGVEAFFDNDLASVVQELGTDEDKWAVIGRPTTDNNMLAGWGERTFNSVNAYPQIETWRLIDPAGEYDEVYNRYAHINIELQEEGDPQFILTSPDAFTVVVAPSSLEELGVTKLMARKDIDLSVYTDQGDIEMLTEVGRFALYRIL